MIVEKNKLSLEEHKKLGFLLEKARLQMLDSLKKKKERNMLIKKEKYFSWIKDVLDEICYKDYPGCNMNIYYGRSEEIIGGSKNGR